MLRARLRAAVPRVINCSGPLPKFVSPSTCATSFGLPPHHINQLYTSHQSFRSSSVSRIQSWLLAISVLGGAGILLGLSFKEPRRLEWEPPEGSSWTRDQEFIQKRYAPVNFPRSTVHADAMLRWHEGSTMIGGSVLRSDHAEVPSNLPAEDLMMQTKATGDNGLVWFINAIFDGHSGIDTAIALQQYLINYLVRELKGDTPDPLTADEADQAIRKAFLDLDKDIMDSAAKAVESTCFLTEAISQIGAAYAGSCALMSYFNEESKELKIACTGDSRAVLGRKDASGIYRAIELSVDQTGFNEAEVSRLKANHPNEPEMIKDGRLLGLVVTRAFGDSRWKWSRKIQEKARDRFFGHELRDHLLSPPYLTAEPIITTTKIQPENGDFLIMASDGLWDNLTSEQTVDLVARWLKTHDISKAPPPPNLTDIPEVLAPSDISKKMKPVPNMAYTNNQKITTKYYVNVDGNAATHLARHALGGGDEDRLLGMATAMPPFSRRLRDDISVQVTFFGNDPDVIEEL